MKKTVAAAILVLALAASAFAQKKGQGAYVSADSDLKKTAGAFAEKSGSVVYGDEVLVLEISGKWAQVQTEAGAEGWMALANLTTKRIVAKGNNRSASASELSLAGKGFTEEIEKEYSAENSLDFSEIDAMERYAISDGKLLGFIENGKLNKGE